MSAYGKLNGRRKAFVDAYVRLRVGSEAYREAYDSEAKRADTLGARLLAKPEIRKAVEERTELAIARAGVHQVRVLEELAGIAFSDLGEFFDEKNELKSMKDLDPKIRRTLQALDTDELFEGSGKDREQIGVTRKLKMHSKIDALKILAQYLRLLPERHEFSGPNGGPIQVKDESELSELDRARRVAFLLARGLALQAEQSESGNPAGVSPPAKSNQQES